LNSEIQKRPDNGYLIKREVSYDLQEEEVKKSSNENPYSLSNEEVQQSVSVYVAAESDPNVTLADFKIHKVIGRGSFGKVYLV
jgi:ABC-type ATPase involved in cell division